MTGLKGQTSHSHANLIVICGFSYFCEEEGKGRMGKWGGRGEEGGGNREEEGGSREEGGEYVIAVKCVWL